VSSGKSLKGAPNKILYQELSSRKLFKLPKIPIGAPIWGVPWGSKNLSYVITKKSLGDPPSKGAPTGSLKCSGVGRKKKQEVFFGG